MRTRLAHRRPPLGIRDDGASGTAPLAHSWAFAVAEKPVITTLTPASGTTTTTAVPVITAKATDNTGIATCSATIDGLPVTPVYDVPSQCVRITPGAIANNASHTAVVTVADAAGSTATKSWTFTIAAPVTTFSGEAPAPSAVLAAAPTQASVNAACTSIVQSGTRKVTVDGVLDPYSAFLNPYPSDLKRATVITYAKALSQDGTHTVSIALANNGGSTATDSWSFSVRVPPTLGTPSPAAGSVVTTAKPAISVPAADNSAVTSWTVTVNGSVVPATYLAGRVQASLATSLPDDADTTVTVSVFDALGLRKDVTWGFNVQAGTVMAGSASDCESCHPGLGTDPDMSPWCFACHAGHTATTTSYHAKAEVSTCKPCHVSSLLVEHARTGLSCATCHAPTASATVKAAIASGNSACSGCHENLTSGHLAIHGTPTASNALTGTTAVCGDCHDANLMTEHAKPTASSSAAGCIACHPSPRSTITTFDPATCAQGGCHKAGTSSAVHGSIAASHTIPAADAGCLGSDCHAGDLGALHAQAPTTTAGITRASCTICHSAAAPPASAHCLTCHSAHGDLTAKHTAVSAASTACLGCHGPAADIRSIHAKRTEGACAVCHNNPTRGNLTTGKNAADCAGCHATEGADFHKTLSTAHVPLSSNGGCLAAGCHEGANIDAIHAKASITVNSVVRKSCAICHVNGQAPVRDCATTGCHAGSEGVGYHAGMVPPGSAEGGHKTGEGGNTCIGAGCHVSMNLATAHATLGGPGTRHPEYPNSCALCHRNPSVDVTARNWSCIGSCHHETLVYQYGQGPDHSTHSNLWAKHAVTGASAACSSCHGADLDVIHGTYATPPSHDVCSWTCHNTNPKCATCHDNKARIPDIWNRTGDCSSCHQDKFTPEANHYVPAKHAAVETVGCDQCHVLELGPEHAKASSGPVTCAGCHTSAGYTSATQTSTGAKKSWDKTCVACHTTTHTAQASSHVSTRAECSGNGCHAIGDVAALHSKAKTVVAGVTLTGCAVCHQSPQKLPTSSDCASCHDLASPHGDLNAVHTSTQTSGYVLVSTTHEGAGAGDVYTCGRCHPTTNLLRLHGSTWNNCSMCHSAGGPRSTFGTWNKTCQQGGCHVSLHNMAVADANHAAVSDELNSTQCNYRHSGTGYDVYTQAQNCTRYCHTTVLPQRGDFTAPVTTAHNVSAYKGPASFQLTAADGESGVHTTFYRVNGGAWTSSLVATTAITVATEGANTLEFCSVDTAGNTEQVRTAQFVVDSTPPVTSTDATTTYSSAGVVNITVADPLPGSGVAATYYRHGRRRMVPGRLVLHAARPVAIRLHREPTLRLYSVDGVGHAESPKTWAYRVPDTEAPYTVLDRQLVTTNPSLSAWDNPITGAAGVKAIYYRYGVWDYENTLMTDWQMYVVSPRVTGTTTVHLVVPVVGVNEMYHIEWYSVDNDGNAESLKRTNFTLERP